MPATEVTPNNGLSAAQQQFKTELIREYGSQAPTRWGENVPGVFTRMATNDKVIALTFDACGGKGGSGYDRELIDYLIKENIPATLFINARWIDANPDTFMSLARNRLFEIENHGYLHRPLSVNGKGAWGISGTQNVGDVVDEVLINAVKIQKLTGRRPIYFRSGTAYYDEVAVKVVDDIGLRAVNFNVLGDAGATFNKSQIKNALLSSHNGAVVICHMNHPEKATAEGVMAAIPELKRRGFRFVKLATYPLK
jgi:peptidoglycan/xylan/chitin deacetylase (PgdA/CDA1 family)